MGEERVRTQKGGGGVLIMANLALQSEIHRTTKPIGDLVMRRSNEKHSSLVESQVWQPLAIGWFRSMLFVQVGLGEPEI